MNSEVRQRREELLKLLASTQSATKALLLSLDPERVVHTDERSWRVRDILGHLGVWNWEAARSLQAHARGSEYHCVPSEGAYYDYNGPAADERRAWPIEQVWAEYDSGHEALRYAVSTMPDDKWDGEMLYPWNARGTVSRLIEIMMRHETRDHCSLVQQAVGT